MRSWVGRASEVGLLRRYTSIAKSRSVLTLNVPDLFSGYTHLSDFDLLVRHAAKMQGVIAGNDDELKELKLSVEQLQTLLAARIDASS